MYTVVEALDELALRLRGRLHEQLRGRDELPGLRRQQVAASNKLVVVAVTSISADKGVFMGSQMMYIPPPTFYSTQIENGAILSKNHVKFFFFL